PKATKEKPSKASTAKPPKLKPTKEKSTKTTLPQPTGKGKVVKVRKGDEDDMELAIQMSQESFQDQSQAYVSGVAIRQPVAEATQPLTIVEGKDQFIFQRRTPPMEASPTGPSAQAQDDTSANIICDSPSLVDAKIVMDEDQAGPDLGESRRALAGPDPGPMHDEFMVDLYSKVQESLKFLADEHFLLEDPISSTETLSSIKNLKDAYAIRD
nr:hypothetical protein [Tanacetum cinerariifolium]